jgi:hypothetical protein
MHGRDGALTRRGTDHVSPLSEGGDGNPGGPGLLTTDVTDPLGLTFHVLGGFVSRPTLLFGIVKGRARQLGFNFIFVHSSPRVLGGSHSGVVRMESRCFELLLTHRQSRVDSHV